MAAPSIRGSTVPATGLSVTSPAGTQVGDLVICITWERAGAGSPTHTVDTGNGFVEIRTHAHDDGSTDGRLSCAYKIATSSGANAYQAYTTSGSGTVRTGCIVLTAGTYEVVTLPKNNSDSGTTNAAPNPPSITSMTGDWLVLAIAGWHLGSAATVTVTEPTNYTETWEAAGSQDVELSLATRALTSLSNATEDPGAFADDVAPNGTARMTIGVRAPNVLTRACAAAMTGAIAAAGVGFTIESRAASAGVTGAIATSGESIPASATVERAASAAVAGLIASTGVRVVDRASALGIAGAAAAAGQRDVLRSTGTSATSGVSVGSQRDVHRSAAAAIGALTAASGIREMPRSASAAIVGAVSTAGTRAVQRAVAASTATLVSAAGSAEGTTERSAGMAATGAITVSGARVASRSAAAGATLAVASNGIRVRDASVALLVANSIETSSLRDVVRTTALACAGLISTSGEVEGDTALTATISQPDALFATLVAVAGITATVVETVGITATIIEEE